MVALSSRIHQQLSPSASKAFARPPEPSAIPPENEPTRSNVLDLRDFLAMPKVEDEWGEFNRWRDLADAWLNAAEELEPQSFETASSKPMFRLEQQWHGVVLAVESDIFHAELVDLTDTEAPRADARFPRHLVEPGDEDLLEPGALFYFSIGQVRRGPGQPIENGHRLRFRRALWSRRDMVRLESRRAQWQELLGTNDAEHATRTR